jgi:hypothetical protein
MTQLVTFIYRVYLSITEFLSHINSLNAPNLQIKN